MRKKFLRSGLLYLMFLAILGACASPTPQSDVKTYQVYTSADYPPFEFVDEATDEIVGFDIDLIKEIAGRSDFEVEINHIPFSDLISEMADCQTDHIYISAMPVRQFSEGEETCYWLYSVGTGGGYQFVGEYCSIKQNPIHFSEPYFQSGQIIVVQSDTLTINGINDLAGRKVGIQVGSVDEDEISEWGRETVLFEDLDSAVKYLLDGGTDAVVMGFISALQYIDLYPGEIRTAGEFINEIPYVIAVCDNSPDKEILNQINDALGEIKADGSLQALTDKWIKND